jgi:transposase
VYANCPDGWAGICSTNGMRHRGELTDQEWERLEPLLPPEKSERGRPNAEHRRIINGILWRERTGAPWRDLPERYGPWSTVYSRFWRWREAGVWDRIFAAAQQQADEAGEVDWSVHFVDGSVIRAHQHAAGAKGGIQKPRRWGAARAASRPRCTSRPTVPASR